MTKKSWLIFAALCIAILGGLVYLSRNNKVDVSSVDITKIQSATSQDGNIADHVYGNTSSKVILVEYGDFQCPGCGSAYASIKEAVEKYKDKIAFVFRSYPLYTSHPNAFAASAAAEAAGLQGKYWEMHDKLYSEQSSWNELTGQARTDYFISAAESIGIDGQKLASKLDDASIKKKINFDEALGKKAGVSGTPSFYIGTKNVGDKYYKDNKIVSSSTDGSALVWSNATAFENLVIVPALKEAGISL